MKLKKSTKTILNIAVGLVVCCTMYAFYTLFRKGDM